MNTDILQTVFSDCPMGIAHLEIIADEQNNSADYRFMEVNKAFLNICSLNQANIIEKTVSQLFPKTETTVTDWHNLFRRIGKSDKAAEFEYYLDELKQWYQVHVYYTDKQFVTLMLIDISIVKTAIREQDEREEELLKTKALSDEINANVTAILEGTADSIWAFDLNYNILYVNHVFQKDFEASFGLKLEKGSNLLNALPEILRPIWKPRYDRALSNEQHTIIDEVDTAIGKLYIQVTFNPIVNKGRVIGGSCFGSNITERKQSELALKQAQKFLAEKEAHYRLIAENSTDLIYVYCLFPEPHYDYISPSCFQLTGYMPEEGYADPFSYHKFINTQAGVERFTQFLLNPTLPTSIEEEWKKKDGSFIWVEQVISRNFDENGNLISFQSAVRDITVRKQMEEMLKNSETEYRNLFENANDAIIIFDPENEIILDANNKSFEIYGFTKDEFIGMSLKQVSKDVKTGENQIVETLKNEFFHNFETQQFNKSREIIHFLVNASVINYRGKVAILSINRNITERKQAEEIIKEERIRLAGIIEGTNAGTWEWNVQTGQVLYNERWAEIIGYRLDEITSSLNTWINFTHPDDLSKSNDLLNKHFVGDMPYYESELRMMHKNGNLVWILDRGKVVSWTDDGKPLLMMGTHQDITERKLAELKLKESEEHLSQLIELAPDAFVHGDNKGNLIGTNNRAAEIFGYPKEELLLMNIKDFFPPEVLQEKPLRFDLLDNGITLKMERKLRRKNGDIIVIEMNSNAMPDGTYQSFIRDITERKQAEEALKENEKSLRDLNAQKDKFFSIIAHDLKSPFNSILGFSQLLVEQIQAKDYEGIEEYAKITLHSSEHAFRLLANLLEWSHAQSGKIDFNPEYFELVDLIEEISPIFEGMAKQKSINIIRSLPRRIPIYADKHMISTILRNLINNSIKFTKQNGEVYITAHHKQDIFSVSVKDNGVGIDKNRIDKLFRIDQNESTPGTANEKGTGLGLILCKEFIDKHKGNIRVESVKGKGSTFTFSIPVNGKL